MRQELGKSQQLARLLKTARRQNSRIPADHRLAAAFATLDLVAASSATTLPGGISQPFGPSWQGLIDQPDRVAALGCFRAATVMTLKRAVRNRSVSVDHSLSYRAPEDKLIPLKPGSATGGVIRDLNLPDSAEKYLQRLEAAWPLDLPPWPRLSRPGTVAIEGDELRVPGASRSQRIHASKRRAGCSACRR